MERSLKVILVINNQTEGFEVDSNDQRIDTEPVFDPFRWSASSTTRT